jgi:hypothetical protein
MDTHSQAGDQIQGELQSLPLLLSNNLSGPNYHLGPSPNSNLLPHFIHP